MRWGSLSPGKEEWVDRGITQMGKDREGHGLGEACVTGAVREVVGESWGDYSRKNTCAYSLE